jgi:hypothetical protein
VKPQPTDWPERVDIRIGYLWTPDLRQLFKPGKTGLAYRCPYGGVGNQLWAQETWKFRQGCNGDRGGVYVTYKADGREGDRLIYDYCGDTDELPKHREGWRPASTMPAWASRYSLTVKGVRVQRTRDASPKDIIAEGLVDRPHFVDGLGKCPVSAFDKICYPDLRSLYAASVKKSGAWDRNVWTWVVSFAATLGAP